MPPEATRWQSQLRSFSISDTQEVTLSLTQPATKSSEPKAEPRWRFPESEIIIATRSMKQRLCSTNKRRLYSFRWIRKITKVRSNTRYHQRRSPTRSHPSRGIISIPDLKHINSSQLPYEGHHTKSIHWHSQRQWRIQKFLEGVSALQKHQPNLKWRPKKRKKGLHQLFE